MPLAGEKRTCTEMFGINAQLITNIQNTQGENCSWSCSASAQVSAGLQAAWQWAGISVQVYAWGLWPKLWAGMLECWLCICYVTAAGVCGQPGDCRSTGMSPGQSPHLLLSTRFFGWFFFPQSNCMMVWTGKQETTFDLQESRGIVVILPLDFPAFLNRKAFLASFFSQYL